MVTKIIHPKEYKQADTFIGSFLYVEKLSVSRKGERYYHSFTEEMISRMLEEVLMSNECLSTPKKLLWKRAKRNFEDYWYANEDQIRDLCGEDSDDENELKIKED